MFHVYDTMTRRKMPLPQQTSGVVRLYLCGPTVYNYIHVGNARPAVVFDTLVRHWRASGLDVRFARNFTDVDDRIINSAVAAGETPQAVADRFIVAYKEDTESLGCLPPTFEPRVSEFIPQIVRLIQTLVEKGHAYELDGDVYFDVTSFADYGKLSHRSVEEWAQEARVVHEAAKRHKADFALWKKAKQHEPPGARWPSPWGEGRPGWHIECSAMVKELFGTTLDVHAGGIDLCFPHHENEIAQTESATGSPLASAWMHNAFVNFGGDKVSKSTLATMPGDVTALFLLRNVRARFDGEAIRLWLVSQHYRSPMDYAFELVERDSGAQTAVRFPSLDDAERLLEYLYDTKQRWLKHLPDSPRRAASSPVSYKEATSPLVQEFREGLDDDLNTPVAFAVLLNTLTQINEVCDQKRPEQARLKPLAEALEYMCAVLGIGLREPDAFFEVLFKRRVAQRGLDEVDIRARVEARSTARTSRDYAKADEIRADLLASGVEVRDEPGGSTSWRVLAL